MRKVPGGTFLAVVASSLLACSDAPPIVVNAGKQDAQPDTSASTCATDPTGCTDATSATLPPSMKGYELYAYAEGDALWFTLITGTNRLKTLDEVKVGATEQRDGDLIVVGVSGLTELEALLARVPSGSEVVLTQLEGLAPIPTVDLAKLEDLLGLPVPDAVDCAAVREEANLAVVRASQEADDNCQTDADCYVLAPTPSCGNACTSAWVSTAGKVTFEAAVAALETDTCLPALRTGCDPAPFSCDSPDFGGRCYQGHCQSQHIGCPDDVTGYAGKSCTEPGLECWNPEWCPPGILCTEDGETGVYRWVEQILLCSVHVGE